MRIVGYIPHPTLKITIFSYENRYSLKFENAQYEQTFKIRPAEGLQNENQIRELVDGEFLSIVEARFKSMHQQMHQAYSKMETTNLDEFDHII